MKNDTELKELFDRMFIYKDGHIEWQHPVKAMKNPAGRVNLRGYRYVNVNYKSYLVHRVIFLMHHGYLPKYVDHIDGNVANNHIDNLQCLTMKDNANRRRSYAKTNKYKLDDNKRSELIRRYMDGESVWKLSREFSIPPNYLYTTFQRGSWKHLCWKNDTENT